MGLLSFLSKDGAAEGQRSLTRLRPGSFTVDPHGRVVVSTLPQSFPASMVTQIGNTVIEVFMSARRAQISVAEILVDYGAVRLTARELRGGAIIFLAPAAPAEKESKLA
jgi:hypothetical protein